MSSILNLFASNLSLFTCLDPDPYSVNTDPILTRILNTAGNFLLLHSLGTDGRMDEIERGTVRGPALVVNVTVRADFYPAAEVGAATATVATETVVDDPMIGTVAGEAATGGIVATGTTKRRARRRGRRRVRATSIWRSTLRRRSTRKS